MIVEIGNRFGFLVPAFVALSEAGVVTSADAFFGAGYSDKHLWTWAVGLFIAAVACWLLGQVLRGRKPPPIVDPETGGQPRAGSAAFARYSMREIEKEAEYNTPSDSFFFMPMYLWGPILAVCGVIVLVAGWLGWQIH